MTDTIDRESVIEVLRGVDSQLQRVRDRTRVPRRGEVLMTTATETPTRVERLVSLMETSLISLANEFSEKVDAEHLAGQMAIGKQDFKAAQHHLTRSRAFIEACQMVNRQVIVINREVTP